MRIVVSSVDEEQERHIFQDIYGEFSEYDDTLIEFRAGNAFDIEGSTYEITGNFSKINKKGSLLVKKNDSHFMNVFLTVHDTYLMILRLSPKTCLEIVVSE